MDDVQQTEPVNWLDDWKMSRIDSRIVRTLPSCLGRFVIHRPHKVLLFPAEKEMLATNLRSLASGDAAAAIVPAEIEFVCCEPCDAQRDLDSTIRWYSMQTVLVLGATGLLGHQVMRILTPRFQVIGTTQRTEVCPSAFLIRDPEALRYRISADHPEGVRRLIQHERPDVVINCIGIVKSQFNRVPHRVAEFINGEFPLQLADMCDQAGSRLIHISTDCVYSGAHGNYSESDLPDPIDVYGRTKLQGEPNAASNLTLRTSFIGMECETANGLVAWLLSQRGGQVRGYTRAIFSGLTTIVLARLLGDLIEQHPELRGIWHVSADPIDKHHLLCFVNEALGLEITIAPDDSVVCDRSLNSSAFRALTGYQPPSWPAMVAEMAADAKSYP